MNVSSASPIVPRPAPPPAARTGGVAQPESSSASPDAQAKSLWDVLTPEEREFFECQAKLGAITYRPGAAAPLQSEAPLGGRIDVKG
jgi:hypothetical protein